MVKFTIYNETGYIVDEGETKVSNIGFITMPLATNDWSITITKIPNERKVA